MNQNTVLNSLSYGNHKKTPRKTPLAGTKLLKPSEGAKAKKKERQRLQPRVEGPFPIRASSSPHAGSWAFGARVFLPQTAHSDKLSTARIDAAGARGARRRGGCSALLFFFPGFKGREALLRPLLACDRPPAPRRARRPCRRRRPGKLEKGGGTVDILQLRQC